MIKYFVKEDIKRLKDRLEEFIKFKKVYDETNKLKDFFDLKLSFEQGIKIYKEHSKYISSLHSAKKIENTLVKYFYIDKFIQNNFLNGKCSLEEAIRIYKASSYLRVDKIRKCLNKQIIKYFKKDKRTQEFLNYKLNLKELLEFIEYYRVEVKIACIQAIINDVSYGYLLNKGVITREDLKVINTYTGNYYKYNEEVEIDEKRDEICEGYLEPMVEIDKLLSNIAQKNSLKYKSASYYYILYDEEMKDDVDYKEIKEIGRGYCDNNENFYDTFQTDMLVCCINNFEVKQKYIDFFESIQNKNNMYACLTDEIFQEGCNFYIALTEGTLYNVLDSELLLTIILAIIDNEKERM